MLHMPRMPALSAGVAAAACRRWMCFLGACIFGLVVFCRVSPGHAPLADTPLPAPDPQPAANEEPITPIPTGPAGDPLKIALGERLFGDPRLSRGNARSC